MSERLGQEHRRLQLEARIRSIERALGDSVSALGGASIVAGINDVDVENAIPTPDGFSVVLGATNITVKWNDPNIPVTEFDFFEVQFALDSSFLTGLVTDKTKSTKYAYIDGDPLTSYFTRMRVALNDGRVSDYTATLNTLTGQIVTEDIDSVTEPASAYTRTATTVANGATEILQSVTLTTVGKSVVILMGFGGLIPTLFSGTIRLLRNSTPLVVETTTAVGDFTYAYVDEAPGSGSTTYEVSFENNTGVSRDIIDKTLIVFEVQVL